MKQATNKRLKKINAIILPLLIFLPQIAYTLIWILILITYSGFQNIINFFNKVPYSKDIPGILFVIVMISIFLSIPVFFIRVFRYKKIDRRSLLLLINILIFAVTFIFLGNLIFGEY